MSIFGNRSSKKKKSSSQAHGLDGAGRYNNPYVDYSPIQHVHRKSPPKDLSILSNGGEWPLNAWILLCLINN